MIRRIEWNNSAQSKRERKSDFETKLSLHCQFRANRPKANLEKADQIVANKVKSSLELETIKKERERRRNTQQMREREINLTEIETIHQLRP